jgi:hypothetical protein
MGLLIFSEPQERSLPAPHERDLVRGFFFRRICKVLISERGSSPREMSRPYEEFLLVVVDGSLFGPRRRWAVVPINPLHRY